MTDDIGLEQADIRGSLRPRPPIVQPVPAPSSPDEYARIRPLLIDTHGQPLVTIDCGPCGGRHLSVEPVHGRHPLPDMPVHRAALQATLRARHGCLAHRSTRTASTDPRPARARRAARPGTVAEHELMPTPDTARAWRGGKPSSGPRPVAGLRASGRPEAAREGHAPQPLAHPRPTGSEELSSVPKCRPPRSDYRAGNRTAVRAPPVKGRSRPHHQTWPRKELRSCDPTLMRAGGSLGTLDRLRRTASWSPGSMIRPI